MIRFRLAIRGALFIGFMIAISNSIYKLFRKQTGLSLTFSSENCPLPVVSVCPATVINDKKSPFKKENNKTMLEFLEWSKDNKFWEIPITDCMKTTESILIYGFGNFVADFGGYLGLLLGASFLSIYDSWVKFFKFIYTKLTKKYACSQTLL